MLNLFLFCVNFVLLRVSLYHCGFPLYSCKNVVQTNIISYWTAYKTQVKCQNYVSFFFWISALYRGHLSSFWKGRGMTGQFLWLYAMVTLRKVSSEDLLISSCEYKGWFYSTMFCHNMTCAAVHLNAVLIAKNAIIIVNRTASKLELIITAVNIPFVNIGCYSWTCISCCSVVFVLSQLLLCCFNSLNPHIIQWLCVVVHKNHLINVSKQKNKMIVSTDIPFIHLGLRYFSVYSNYLLYKYLQLFVCLVQLWVFKLLSPFHNCTGPLFIWIRVVVYFHVTC